MNHAIVLECMAAGCTACGYWTGPDCTTVLDCWLYGCAGQLAALDCAKPGLHRCWLH